KLETAARKIPEMEKSNFFPSSKKQDEAALVSWGSTKGPILDAMKLLEKDGISVEFLKIRLANPFPTESVKEKLSKAKLPIDIEQNYSGQMAQVIAEKTMIDINNKILKYNGRPMTQDEIYESVKRIISNPTQNKRMVLTKGAKTLGPPARCPKRSVPRMRTLRCRHRPQKGTAQTATGHEEV